MTAREQVSPARRAARFCLPRSFNLYTPQALCRMALAAVLSVGQRCVIAFRRHPPCASRERSNINAHVVVIPPIHIECASYCLLKLPSLHQAALRGRAGWGNSLAVMWRESFCSVTTARRRCRSSASGPPDRETNLGQCTQLLLGLFPFYRNGNQVSFGLKYDIVIVEARCMQRMFNSSGLSCCFFIFLASHFQTIVLIKSYQQLSSA